MPQTRAQAKREVEARQRLASLFQRFPGVLSWSEDPDPALTPVVKEAVGILKDSPSLATEEFKDANGMLRWPMSFLFEAKAELNHVKELLPLSLKHSEDKQIPWYVAPNLPEEISKDVTLFRAPARVIQFVYETFDQMNLDHRRQRYSRDSSAKDLLRREHTVTNLFLEDDGFSIGEQEFVLKSKEPTSKEQVEKRMKTLLAVDPTAFDPTDFVANSCGFFCILHKEVFDMMLDRLAPAITKHELYFCCMDNANFLSRVLHYHHLRELSLWIDQDHYGYPKIAEYQSMLHCLCENNSLEILSFPVLSHLFRIDETLTDVFKAFFAKRGRFLRELDLCGEYDGELNLDDDIPPEKFEDVWFDLCVSAGQTLTPGCSFTLQAFLLRSNSGLVNSFSTSLKQITMMNIECIEHVEPINLRTSPVEKLLLEECFCETPWPPGLCFEQMPNLTDLHLEGNGWDDDLPSKISTQDVLGVLRQNRLQSLTMIWRCYDMKALIQALTVNTSLRSLKLDEICSIESFEDGTIVNPDDETTREEVISCMATVLEDHNVTLEHFELTSDNDSDHMEPVASAENEEEQQRLKFFLALNCAGRAKVMDPDTTRREFVDVLDRATLDKRIQEPYNTHTALFVLLGLSPGKWCHDETTTGTKPKRKNGFQVVTSPGNKKKRSCGGRKTPS